MPGGAEDKVTAFSFVQHGRLAQPPHFRGGNLRFQPEAGGTRAGKLPGQRARSKEEWFTQTRDEKKPEQTRSPWPPIALVPGFLLTCHGTFRIAIRGLATFRVILRPEAKKRRAGRQGFLLVPPQRPPHCGSGFRQIGQCFSPDLTNRLLCIQSRTSQSGRNGRSRRTRLHVIPLNLASISGSNRRPLTDWRHSADPSGEARRGLSTIVGSCTRSRER